MLLSIFRSLGKGVFLCAFSLFIQVHAGKVRLEWDPSPDLVVTRYRVYASADLSNFGSPVAVTFGTRAEVNDLIEGQLYYFGVTAVDLFGNESDFSNLVSHHVAISPPTAESLNVTLLKDSTTGFELSGMDVGNDELNFRVLTLPANGKLTGTSPHLVYQPNPNFSGVDRFTYVVSDDVSISLPATVTINVIEQNAPPTLIKPPEFVPMRELETLGIPLSGITSGTENEAQPLTVTASSSNANLVEATVSYASPNNAGMLNLRTREANGAAVITVTVSDGLSSVQHGLLVLVEATPPVISDIVEQSNDARTLTIHWWTDRVSGCVVEYGSTTALGLVSAESVGTIHSVRLSNLQPDTIYYLRVRANSSSGSSVSGISTASTEPVRVIPFSAEAGQLTSPMFAIADSGVQNDRYIVSQYDAGTADFPMNVPHGLNYRIWARVKAPTGGGAFYVSADGGVESLVQVPENESADGWGWQLFSRTNAADSDPLLIPFDAGVHQITIRSGIANTAVDEFFLSNDPLWRPTLAGSRPILAIRGDSILSSSLNWSTPAGNADSIGIEWSIDGENFSHLTDVPAAWSAVGVQSLLSTSVLYFRIYAFNSTERSDYSNVVQRSRLLGTISPL